MDSKVCCHVTHLQVVPSQLEAWQHVEDCVRPSRSDSDYVSLGLDASTTLKPGQQWYVHPQKHTCQNNAEAEV
jgi:hypothetical protein